MNLPDTLTEAVASVATTVNFFYKEVVKIVMNDGYDAHVEYPGRYQLPNDSTLLVHDT